MPVLLAMALLLLPGAALAETFNLPGGPLPDDCSASGNTVTCTDDVELDDDDVVIVDGPVDWDIQGDFSADEDVSVNTGGAPDDLNIDATGDVDIGEESSVNANVSAGGDVSIDEEGNIGGNVSADGDVSVDEEGAIGGDVISGGEVDVEDDGTINGCVSAGSITNNGTINCGSDIALIANRTTVGPGDSITVAVAAQGCDGVGAEDGWVDEWSAPDGFGVPDTGTQEYGTAPCERAPSRTITAPDTPGQSFEITFISRYCLNNGCPTQQQDEFGRDSITITISSGDADDVAISGQVLELGSGREGVDIVVDGGPDVTTDTDGRFSATVPSGTDVTLTPQHDDLIFCPSSRTLSNVTTDRFGESFTAFPDTAPEGAGSGGEAVYQDGQDIIHVFCATGSSTFSPPGAVDAVDVLVVGGGGGGGTSTAYNDAGSGGGGAGGVVFREDFAIAGDVDVTVGAGGAPGSPGNNSGANGLDSIFAASDALVALGGGGGAGGNTQGEAGGSGGGSRGDPGGPAEQPGSPSGGDGNRGGDSGGSPAGAAASGGGGASATGEDLAGTSNEPGGDGGAGAAFTITGSSVTYAGGGGGGVAQDRNDPGAGGAGGGGRGAADSVAPEPGAPATGGGGGGGNNSRPGAAGGSGIVVVRYPQLLSEPVLEYRMEEDAWDGTPGEVIDASGNGNDGTARNGATTSRTDPLPAIPGDPGTCRYGEFDGEDDFVRVPHDDSLEMSDTDAVTVTAWVRKESTQSGWIAIAQKSDESYNLQLNNGNEPTFTIHDGGWNHAYSGVTLNNGQWYHLAGTYDGNEIRIYVDGTLEGTGTANGNLSDASGSDVGIGENLDAPGRHFDGQLDEIRIFDAALSQAKIADAASNTRPCPAAGLTCTAREFDDALGSEWDTESVSGSFGQPRAVNGALRLTDATGNVSTRATILNAIPWDDNRVEVEFRYFSYGGSSDIGDGGDADGIAVAFSDADVTPAAGGFGGSLGYAQLDDPPTDGFAGGWLGIGIDEFGNYSNPTEGRQDGTGFVPDAVAIRGDAAGGYRYIDGTGPLTPALSSPNVEDRSNLDGDLYRIVVDTTEPGIALVQIERDTTGTGDNYDLLLEEDVADDQETTPPEEVYLSFTGSTGGSTNIHEIDFLEVCANRGLESSVAGYSIGVGTGTASTCEPRRVSITAEDSSGDPLTDYTGDVAITTSSGHGTWTTNAADGTLTDATEDDGATDYGFVDSDDGTIALDLTNQHADDLTITVTESDGSPSSTSDTLSFRHNAFIIEPLSALANKDSDDIVAGLDQPFQATLVRREPAASTGQCSIATDYDEPNQNVKLWIERHSDDPGGGAPAATGTTLPDSKPGGSNITLDFSAGTLSQAGRAPFSLETTDVGKYALLIEDTTFAEDSSGSGTPNPRPVNGNTADLVVRPFGLRVTADGNPAATDANGPAYRAAGIGFDVGIAGVQYDGADDDGSSGGIADDGVPDGHTDADATAEADLTNNSLTPSFGNEGTTEAVELTSRLLAPVGGRNPGLDGEPVDYTAFSGGSATNSEIWREVGIIELEAALTGYLGSGRNLDGRSGEVGRFIPARLEATGNTPSFEPFCDTGTDFTYLDQPFGYATDPEVSVTAREAGPSGATTQNYGAAFWKLPVPAAFPNRGYTDQGSSAATLSDDDASTTIVWDDGGSDGLTGSDTATISGERMTYGRNGLEAPFDAAVDLTIPAGDITDSDGVCPAASGTCNTGGGNTGTDLVFDGDGGTAGQQPIGGTELRFGRLRLDDAYGPEVAPVIQRWQLDYWTGETWARNTDDTCTVLALADEVELDPDDTAANGNELDGTGEVDLSSGNGTTQIDEALDVMSGSVLVSGGVAEVRYEQPNAGNRGWIETRALLAADFPHLLADTDGDGVFDDEPSGRVTFGIFAGDSEQIYLREIFPSP